MGLLRKGGLRVPRKVLSLRAGLHRHTMQYLHIVCLLLLSVVVSPLSGRAAAYYLATNGSDAHLGTSAKPWATFAHAWSVMRPGDTLLVKDGIYMQSIAPTVSARRATRLSSKRNVTAVSLSMVVAVVLHCIYTTKTS